jgi:hypothetical protein
VAVVLVGQEVVTQDGRVRQRLQDAVHKACVAQVDQPSQTCSKQNEHMNSSQYQTIESTHCSKQNEHMNSSQYKKTESTHLSTICLLIHIFKHLSNIQPNFIGARGII